MLAGSSSKSVFGSSGLPPQAVEAVSYIYWTCTFAFVPSTFISIYFQQTVCTLNHANDATRYVCLDLILSAAIYLRLLSEAFSISVWACLVVNKECMDEIMFHLADSSVCAQCGSKARVVTQAEHSCTIQFIVLDE